MSLATCIVLPESLLYKVERVTESLTLSCADSEDSDQNFILGGCKADLCVHWALMILACFS